MVHIKSSKSGFYYDVFDMWHNRYKAPCVLRSKRTTAFATNTTKLLNSTDININTNTKRKSFKSKNIVAIYKYLSELKNQIRYNQIYKNAKTLIYKPLCWLSARFWHMKSKTQRFFKCRKFTSCILCKYQRLQGLNDGFAYLLNSQKVIS